MRAKILSAPPPSGSLPEHRYDASGHCVWVLFEHEEGEEWAGVFGADGVTSSKAVTLFNDARSALVIARGQGYIVDTASRELSHRSECASLVESIAIPGRDLVAACDFTSIFFYCTAGPVWRSERIALDGVRFESADANELRGSCWVGEWRSFRLDLESRSFLAGPSDVWKQLP